MKKPPDEQDRVFLESEGDSWFQRNKAVLIDREYLALDPVLKVLELSEVVPENVLEVGASNGYRLQEIKIRYGCQVTAVEPSLEAIKDGQSRYPAVSFVRGLVNDIPVSGDQRFDLVIANFVLHWVDRSALFASVSEIDRMLKDGGFLVLGDFAPSHPAKVKYHHLPDSNVWTYKQNYSEIFLASNLYSQMAALTYDHELRQMKPHVESSNRAHVVLLQKSFEDRYLISDFNRE